MVGRVPLPNAIGNLLVEILGSTAHPLAREMAGWMTASKRFRAFAETYRDKIRKKVRSSQDRERLRDLQGELAVAYLLLEEPRFAVRYELQNATKQRAPDFTVIFRENLTFHVEVTRLHTGPDEARQAPESGDRRLANTLSAKLGQMQAGAINVLVVLTEGAPYDEAGIVTTTRALLVRASNKDEAYFAAQGFRDARDFLHQYERLSGILALGSWQRPAETQVVLWENNQARHPIPGPISAALRRMSERRPPAYGQR